MVYYLQKKPEVTGLGRIRLAWDVLPLYRKFVLPGLIASVVGLFLPWFFYGNFQPTGLTNLTFAIGYLVLFFFLISTLVFVAHLLGLKLPRLFARESTIYLFCGFQIFLLSLVAFTIYGALVAFVVQAGGGPGVFVSMVGGLILGAGGYVRWREERLQVAKKTLMTLSSEEDGLDLSELLSKSRKSQGSMGIEMPAAETETTEKDDRQISMFDR